MSDASATEVEIVPLMPNSAPTLPRAWIHKRSDRATAMLAAPSTPQTLLPWAVAKLPAAGSRVRRRAPAVGANWFGTTACGDAAMALISKKHGIRTFNALG